MNNNRKNKNKDQNLGFNVFFNGANKDRANEINKKMIEKRKIDKGSNIKLEDKNIYNHPFKDIQTKIYDDKKNNKWNKSKDNISITEEDELKYTIKPENYIRGNTQNFQDNNLLKKSIIQLDNNEINILKNSIKNIINNNLSELNPLEIDNENKNWQFDKLKEENNNNYYNNNKNKFKKNINNSSIYNNEENILLILRNIVKVKNRDPNSFQKLISYIDDLNEEKKNTEQSKKEDDFNNFIQNNLKISSNDIKKELNKNKSDLNYNNNDLNSIENISSFINNSFEIDDNDNKNLDESFNKNVSEKSSLYDFEKKKSINNKNKIIEKNNFNILDNFKKKIKTKDNNENNNNIVTTEKIVEKNVFNNKNNKEKVNLILESINFQKYEPNKSKDNLNILSINNKENDKNNEDNKLKFIINSNHGSVLDISFFKIELINTENNNIKLIPHFIIINKNQEKIKLKNIKNILSFDNNEFEIYDFMNGDIIEIIINYSKSLKLNYVNILNNYKNQNNCIKNIIIFQNNTKIIEINLLNISSDNNICNIDIINKTYKYKNNILFNEKNLKSQTNFSSKNDYKIIGSRRKISNVKINFKSSVNKNNDNDILNNIIDSKNKNPIKYFEKKKNIKQCLDILNLNKNNVNKSENIEKEKLIKKDNKLNFTMLIENNKNFNIKNINKIDHLIIEIYSTWDDKFYVGLCGIEIFNKNGDNIIIDNLNISADPANINVLNEYNNDPRTIEKLVDEHYVTTDDNHSWLSPFNSHTINKIYINFDDYENISMIRFWNYNKSRIHSIRGVKDIVIKTNEEILFFGQIKKASGNINECYKNSTEIFFNINENILKNIEIYDKKLNNNIINNDYDTINYINEKSLIDMNERPKTRANINKIEKIRNFNKIKKKTINLEDIKKFIECKKITIQIKENWGNIYKIGLTGIEFFDENSNLLKINENCITSNQQNININKLLNSKNITSDKNEMVEFDYNDLFIYIDFETQVKISFIKIYNYNNKNNRNYGVKLIKIISDINNIITKFDYFIKQGYGSSLYDFGQIIYFPIELNKPNLNYNFINNKDIIPEIVNKFPCGFIIEIKILKLFKNNDNFELEGIEIFDYQGNDITNICNIHFLQNSNNNIEDLKYKKGFKGQFLNYMEIYNNELLGESSIILIDYDKIISLGMINIYNNNSDFGIKEIQIKIDNNIIFTGELNSGNLNSILFGNKIIFKNCNFNIYNGNQKQKVLFENEKIKSYS